MLAPGNIIRERYEVQALIGQGGMGAVYRVVDLRLPGRLCALKIMRFPSTGLLDPASNLDAEALQAARDQFLAEASTLARLDQPNLPKVSDYFTLEAYDCLVMDYVPGRDLLQHIHEARREGRFLAEKDVLDWAGQLCDVLQYLHGQQPAIIHGDVKPANIKLTGEGRIKLVDFGLARPGDPDDPRTLTGPGLRGLGSLSYAALEQYAGGGRADPRSDLYSLGATLYHLVTNQAPPDAHERFLDGHAMSAPREINPALSSDLQEAILAALQIHPKDRPPSVVAWRRLLPLSGTAADATAPGAVDLAERVEAPFSSPEAEPGQDMAGWREALAANRWYALGAGLLLLAALALTFLK